MQGLRKGIGMTDRYPIPEFLRQQPAQIVAKVERPILFSGPMIRALLADTKTQTRRHLYKMRKLNRASCVHRDYPPPRELTPVGQGWAMTDWRRAKAGDQLWVREAWGTASIFDDVAPRDLPSFAPIKYYADGKIVGATAGYGLMLKARPSIHMPRRFSRILLEIVDIRVERLQDISEADAMAEGWVRRPEVSADPQVHADAARDWYSDLWEQINGAGSWAVNPWVWVVEFKRVGK